MARGNQLPFFDVELNNVDCDARSEARLRSILDAPRERKIVDEPYNRDISAGKNTYVYDAHTYHTKVPPQGIAALIDYYTNPGEVVLDSFCGSGMTGVAAAEMGRRAILSDLSPAAVFIAENLNTPADDVEFLTAVDHVLASCEDLNKYLYATSCRDCGKEVAQLYTVWSYGVECNECRREFVLWDVARDERERVRDSKIKKTFDCPHCKSRIAKRGLKRTSRYPVQIGYKCCSRGRKESCAVPDQRDIDFVTNLAAGQIPSQLWYPKNQFPAGVNTRQPIAAGIISVDKAYTPRALWAMARLWHEASNYPVVSLRNKLRFVVTSLYQRVTLFSEFRFWGGSGNTANYNVPQIINEQNVFFAFKRKAQTISWYFRDAPRFSRQVHLSVKSACHLENIPNGSVDFVFTDPPFGSNINYSEMNFLWESWLGEYTNTAEEAIISRPQNKTADDYETLLCQAFLEAHRVLRDDGWMCVVFHNSSEKVWRSLQNAIQRAGFEVRAAQTFDKQHATFKMFVSDNAVGYDLVLHCRKQNRKRVERVLTKLDKQEVRSFISSQLTTNKNYVVRYLHVARRDEFDYRKMYAEWLCSSFSSSEISMSFEEFRTLVDDARKEIL